MEFADNVQGLRSQTSCMRRRARSPTSLSIGPKVLNALNTPTWYGS